MPTVPTSDALGYQPIGTLPTVQSTPNDFGAQIGQASEKLGNDLSSASNDLSNVALRNQERQNQIAANNATNQLMSGLHNITSGDPNNPNDTGYFGLKGQAAIDGRKDAFQKITDLQSSISSSLQNPLVKSQFDADSRRYINMTQGGMDNHFEQQTNVAALDSAKSSEQLAMQGLSIYAADENGFQTHLAALDNAVHNQVAAIGGTNEMSLAALQAAHEKAYTQRVQSLVGQGNLQMAQSVLQSNESQFSPAVFEELQQRLRPQLDRAAGQAAFQAVMPGIAGSSSNIADAIHGQESGGAAASQTSVNGARGGFQITPGTFQQYALPGENIDNPADNARVGNRIIDDYKARYNGDPARVAVAYFSGPGNVAPPGSATPYLQDKADGNGTTTSSYVQGVLGRMGGSASPANPPATFAPSVPDLDSAISKIEAMPNLSMEAKQHAISLATEYHHTMVAATASDRATLTSNLSDGIAALQAGKDYTPDTGAIQRLMPDKADQILQQINEAKTVGQATKGVSFAAPDEIMTKLTQLRGALNSPQNFVENSTLLDAYQKAVNQRAAALSADPASYVANSPVVKQAASALTNAANDPTQSAAATENYVRTSLAEQDRLGVPQSQQHVLANQQAADLVSKITSADPATTDIGAMMSKQAQAYGRYWPQVYGDLVQAKLPGTYQVLAAMDGPDQARARTDLQTTMKAASEMGGVAKFRSSLPEADTKTIDAGVGSALQDFQSTTRLNTDGQALYGNVAEAVKLQAYGYVARQGMDGSNAVAAAAKAVIGDRYDMDGTMRVPKGTMDDVRTATGNVLNGLKPTDLADIGGDAALTPEQRQGIALDAAKRGTWVPNHDDTGLVRMGVQKGGYSVVRLANGQPLQVPFASAKDLANPKLPPASVDEATNDVPPGGP